MFFGKMPRFAYAEFHYRIYNKDLIKKKISDIGMVVFDVKSSYILISTFYNRFLGYFGELMGSKFSNLGEHFIVYAKKKK